MTSGLRIFVGVKHGVDVALTRPDPTSGAVSLEGAPRKTSDFDRNAVEEAVRIRERGGGTVTAISVGAPSAREALRDALAIGADEAVLFTDPASPSLDTRGVARALAATCRTLGGFDLLLLGEGSTDHFAGLVGPRVAAELDVPDLSYVRRLTLEPGGVVAERDLEQEVEVVYAPFPVVVTVGQEINTPRLPTFMANLKASKKTVRQLGPGEVGLPDGALTPVQTTLRVAVPQVTRKQVTVTGSSPDELAQELLSRLRAEGVWP
jgi:electron transfer flavoprotein beta subunit